LTQINVGCIRPGSFGIRSVGRSAHLDETQEYQEEKMFAAMRKTILALVPVLAVGACTTLSDQDRALLASASQNAQQAKDEAAQALAAAQAAQATAQAAQTAAQSAAAAASQAAADAKSANEKTDRMFQRSLRKS
jgi:hypothetical protein